MPPLTYTAEISIHAAHNLPVADISTLSCDPYIQATLFTPTTSSKKASKSDDSFLDDPPLSFRTPTIRRTRQAEWCPTTGLPGHTADCQTIRDTNNVSERTCMSSGKWIVAGLPKSGFILHVDAFDEDRGNADDHLGRAVIDLTTVPLHDKFELKLQQYELQQNSKSIKGFRTIVQTYVAAVLPKVKHNRHGHVIISVVVIGKTEEYASEKPFTVGPIKWSQHFSPLIGALQPARHATPEESTPKTPTDKKDSKAVAFDDQAADATLSSSVFIGNKLQLVGPVPPELRHKFVSLSPKKENMFRGQGFRGYLTSRANHKQYRTIYSYDKNTRFGIVSAEDDPKDGGAETSAPETNVKEAIVNRHSAESRAVALQFLRMCSFGAGGRMFTYILTLDGEWRWTETGAEFAVNKLSKHTMHADVEPVVAWAGEFFVRRIVEKPGGGFPSAVKVEDGTLGEESTTKEEETFDGKEAQDNSAKVIQGEELGEGDVGKGDAEPSTASDEELDEEQPKDDPSLYELVIDNDSGTYQPRKELLPVLREWLSDPRRLGALGRITAVDGQDPTVDKAKEVRQSARTKHKGMNGADSPGKPPKGQRFIEKAKKHGPLGEAVAKVEEAREEALEVVRSKNKRKDSDASRRVTLGSPSSDSISV